MSYKSNLKSMKMKSLSMILVMLLVLGALSGCGNSGTSSTPSGDTTEAVTDTTTPAATDNNTESVSESTDDNKLFAGGSGTAEDPWQVATAEQLDRIRDDLTAHYILIDDIDLSGYENWIPIGAFHSKSDAP